LTQRSPPHQSLTPSPWVACFAALIAPASRVLDLASGHGRNARYLAGLGHRVLAVDRDEAALAALASATLAVPRIETLRADLEGAGWPLGDQTFDAVIVTHYLHRPLFPHIAAALGPGAVLIYETFARGNAAYGRPSNPDFLLEPNELLDRFGGILNVIAFEQGYVEQPFAAVVQRLCAVGRAREWPPTLPSVLPPTLPPTLPPA
jgi:SAM-dependent methyltransferase